MLSVKMAGLKWKSIAKSASNQALRFVIFGEYKRYVWGNRPKVSQRPPRPRAPPPCSGAAPSLSSRISDAMPRKAEVKYDESEGKQGNFGTAFG